MRFAGLVILLCVGGVAGCKNNGDAAPDPNAVKAQQDLIGRRDALLKQRQQLQADRDKIDAEIKDVQAKGGDPSDLVKKRADIDTQLESRTTDLISTLSNKVEAIQVSGDRNAAIANREAEIGTRERVLADREAKLADRERTLATRESEAAQRWKDSCTMSAAPVIIQGGTKSGTYTKKDVAEMISKAKGTMSKKGILNGDLPGPTQQLESEASKAMNENDFSKAYFAAAQLVGQVDALQINRGFIQTKTARLQGQIKTSKVDDTTNQQLDTILRDVMTRYNAGDFVAANKRLNQLAEMLH